LMPVLHMSVAPVLLCATLQVCGPAGDA
jgi:hypothetical protein